MAAALKSVQGGASTTVYDELADINRRITETDELSTRYNDEARSFATRRATSKRKSTEAIAESIRYRWDFGSLLVAERGTRGRLINKMRERVCAENDIDRTEFGYRLRFAEHFPASGDLTEISVKYSSWEQIKRMLDSGDVDESEDEPAQENESQEDSQQAAVIVNTPNEIDQDAADVFHQLEHEMKVVAALGKSLQVICNRQSARTLRPEARKALLPILKRALQNLEKASKDDE